MNKSTIVVASSVLAGVLILSGIGVVFWMKPEDPKPAPPPKPPEVKYAPRDLNIEWDKLSTPERKSMMLQRAMLTNSKDLSLAPGSEEVVKDTKFMSQYLADSLSAGKTKVIQQAIELNPELVKITLDAPDASGILPCAIAMFGDVELLNWLVTKFPETVNAGQPNGTSLLHAAISGADSETINWLIANHKELLLATDSDGRTPLHALVSNNDAWRKLDMPKLVRAMVDASPDTISAKDTAGMTAVDLMGVARSEESPFRITVRQIIGTSSPR